MISTTQVLRFELYAASTYLAHRNGSTKHRFCYFTYLRFGPFLGIIAFPLAIWYMIHVWQLPGKNHGGEFGGACALVWYAGYMGVYRWIFLRKMRKSYQVQELSVPMTLEFSPEQIHCIIKGRAETRFTWAYFDSFAESEEMFTLLKRGRLLFLSIGKESLKSAQQDELRALLLAKLGPAL